MQIVDDFSPTPAPNVPAKQKVQTVMPDPVWYRPATQLVQTVDDFSPPPVPNFPAEHRVHTDSCCWSAKEPATQLRHSLDPALDAYLPVTQKSHVSAAVAPSFVENVPVAHRLHTLKPSPVM